MSDRDAIFDVEAFGPFDEDHLTISFDPAPIPPPAVLEPVIADAWAAKQTECRESGAMLFNGPLVKLYESVLSVRGDVLTLRTGPTDYRTFVGTNLACPDRIEEIGREHFSNPIGTTATVISNDGFLLYGRRNQRVAYHGGYLHTIGGALEPGETQADGSLDAFASVRRELAEEIRITAEEIEAIHCVGLIRDREIHQPELLFDVAVSLSQAQLLTRLDPDDPHQEHSKFEVVPDEPDALVPFMRGAHPIAPVAIGAILLHGRRRWGETWYADACARMIQTP